MRRLGVKCSLGKPVCRWRLSYGLRLQLQSIESEHVSVIGYLPLIRDSWLSVCKFAAGEIDTNDSSRSASAKAEVLARTVVCGEWRRPSAPESETGDRAELAGIEENGADGSV